jgi:hypothetical protein
MPESRNRQICVSGNSNCPFCTDPNNVRLGLKCSSVSYTSDAVQQPRTLGGATDYFSSQLDGEEAEAKLSDVGCATEFSLGSPDSAAEVEPSHLPSIAPSSMPTLRDLYPPTDFTSGLGSETRSVGSVEFGSPSSTQNLKQKSTSPRKCRRVEGMNHASRSILQDDDHSDDEDNFTILSLGSRDATRRILRRVHTTTVVSDVEPSVTVSSLARSTARPTSTLASLVDTAIEDEQVMDPGCATEFSADATDAQECSRVEDGNEEKV